MFNCFSRTGICYACVCTTSIHFESKLKGGWEHELLNHTLFCNYMF